MLEAWEAGLLQTCLGLKAGERVLVLVDEPLRLAGERLVSAALAMGAREAVLRPVAVESRRLQVVSHSLLSRVAEADAVLSLFTGLAPGQAHPMLQALLAAFRSARRGRWAFGHSVNPANPALDLTADYERVSRLGRAVAGQLTAVDRVRIQTAAGTDLTFRIRRRLIAIEDGLLRTPGSFCNLPAGEVYVAPLEESAEGDLVVDVSAGGLALAKPLRLRFLKGQAVEIRGPSAQVLGRMLGSHPYSRTIGEFGIGVNPYVTLTGRTPVDEKVLGTIHIALGANTAFGGENPADTHCDCVIRAPQVTLDGASLLWPE